ncbi:hypothetical protein ACFXKC_18000 [Streptomyces sp. NPDC059340]|uniref:hypothetical protein n=1 Tax=Streptomyces sp. NPDC059340 TaxID=3346806 RepID=UPI003685C415
MIRDPDALRVVWLFGKSYWWTRSPGGRLDLVPVTLPPDEPPVSVAEAVARMFNRPFPWPPGEEQPGG